MPGATFDMSALDALAEAQRRFPGVLSARMTAAARRVIVPAVSQEMRRRPAPGQVKRMVIPGSYAQAGFGGYTAVAGVSREFLSGGARAFELARAFEFGTAQHGQKTWVRRGGTRYQRDTTAQLPTRRRDGWVFYPAMGKVAQRAVPLYAQLAVLTVAESLEGKL
jgi:hypothetical protein